MQPTVLAMIAAWRGDLDEAFAMLGRALEEKDGIVYAITTWPMARPLWDDPRYTDLLDRLGVSPPAVRPDGGGFGGRGAACKMAP